MSRSTTKSTNNVNSIPAKTQNCLISLRCALNRKLRNQGFFTWSAMTLIRLCGCPGWTELSLVLVFSFLFHQNIWATSWENLFLPYANNKGADQPAQMWRLISAFVVHCIDSIIPILAKSNNFKTLASLCSWACWFESSLVGNHEDRFSCDIAHI